MAQIPTTTYDRLSIDDFVKSAEASTQTLKVVEGKQDGAVKKRIYVDEDNALVDERGVRFIANGKTTIVCDTPVQVKYLIKNSDGDVSRIIQIGNDADLELDEPFFICVSNKDYSSASRFKTELLKYQIVFDIEDKMYYKFLKAMPKVSAAEFVETLGFHAESKAFFFANAAVKDGKAYYPDDFGLVRIPVVEDGKEIEKVYYMPYVESISGGDTNDELAKSFVYSDNNEYSFNKWFQLFYQCHKKYCIMPTVFFIATLFRDVIFSHTGNFPILYLMGQKGSGKSSIVRSLTALAGKPQEVTNLLQHHTAKALSKKMAQKSNFMLWWDEYMETKIQEFIHGLVQSLYDGSGYSIAMSKGLGTKTYTPHTGLALTSNYFPTNDVVSSRLIFVKCDETKKTDEQSKAWDKLEEIEKENLSNICLEILQHRSLIESEYKEVFKLLRQELKSELRSLNPDIRYINSVACILAPAYILLANRKIFMVEMDYVKSKLLDLAKQTIIDLLEMTSTDSPDRSWWNVLNILYNSGAIRKGIDFRFVALKKDDGSTIYNERIAFRLSLVYEHYKKFSGNDRKSLQEIKQKLENAEYFEEYKTSMVFEQENGSTTRTSAHIFNYNKLKAMGANFGL